MMKQTHDVRIDRTKLHPWLDFKLTKFLDACKKANLFVIVTEGYRTRQYQDSLYAQGRTKPGNIVTNAKGSEYRSQHQWGIAFDIAINDPNKTYDTALLNKAGAIGKKVGLGWGGDWKSLTDRPHFYLTPWGSTTVSLKKTFKTPEQFKKTWKATTTYAKGLHLYKNKLKTETIMLIPNKSTVEVLYQTKLWYARVRFKGEVGFVRKKYIV